MKREKSIYSLLIRTQSELYNITKAYSNLKYLLEVPDSTKIDIHDFLAHNRAILDYLAQELAESCSPKPKRPKFPIASLNQNVAEFEKELKGQFPGLQRKKPELFNYLLDIQHFRDSPWLFEFNQIVNFNKHNNLSAQSHSEFISLIISFKGVGPHIGELGIKSINIGPGGSLLLRSPDGDTRAIRGPQKIDIDTDYLNNADPNIDLIKVKWKDFKFDQSANSTVGLLKIIDINVRRICLKISSIIKSKQ